MIAIVDLALAILIAIAAGIQGEFLPATLNGCKGDKPDKWQVSGNSKSLFVLAADLGPYINSGEACL